LRAFDALRRHRLALARREGVPPYVIASDRTLREIAALRPSNLRELERAHGIGPARRDRYGAGPLAVVMGGIEPPARAEYRGLGAGGV
jgi:ATP-dependent DNA helicase RecQ